MNHSYSFKTRGLTIVLTVSLLYPVGAMGQTQSPTQPEPTPLVTPAATAPAAEEKIFSDISLDSPFYLPTRFLKEEKIIEPYSDGSYQPNELINKAEALTLILKSAGIDTESDTATVGTIPEKGKMNIIFPAATNVTLENVETGEQTALQNITSMRVEVDRGEAHLKTLQKENEQLFEDVSEKNWFYDIAKTAYKNGVIKGTKKKGKEGMYFQPKKHVNLAEALHMVFLAHGTVLSLADMSKLPESISSEEWYAADIAYALSHSIILQKSDGGFFSPGKELRRGELAILLYRFMKNKRSYAEFGYASWYGDGLAKTKLTVGTEYAERSLTAAHRTLPFGTILHVTNMSNGKEVDVVVNDRGPYVTGRIVDLSRSAFTALESTSVGVISVQVEPKNP